MPGTETAFARQSHPAPEGAAGIRLLARDLTRVYADRKRELPALGPVNLEVRDGEFVCVVGPSGCGKSTLLRLIAGILRPTSGEMEILHTNPDRHLVSVVFQEYSIFPWLTVAQNVRTGLDLATHLRKEQKRERVDYWLRRLGLADFANAYPGSLSGGMRQRVSIARALAVDPEILVMDEPFAALDAQLRTLLQDELAVLWEQDRRTVVFVTHSLDEAILLGDRVLIMSARPGVIRSELHVPFPRPRGPELRGSAEFGALVQQTWDVLREEVMTELALSRGDEVGPATRLGGG